MRRIALILFFLVPVVALSQDKLSFQEVDSLTYQFYLKGEWKNLVELTKVASHQDIYSKFIHQRAGYAYFMSGDYFSAKDQYEKALSFDQADNLTREYLYYSNLFAGSMNSRLYAGNLSSEAATRLGVRKFNPVESVDMEYNLKTNQETTRSNQIYYRAGINTELGYRVSLYQAYSWFEQYINNVLTKQPEYLAIVKITPTPSLLFTTSYHRLFTTVGSAKYPANLGYIALTKQLNRFNFSANASILKSSQSTTQQYGFQAGVVLPGKSSIYFTSAVAEMIENSAYRTIFAETAGLKLAPNLWAEGNITIGDLSNYNTINSLYIYNSADPSVFKTGFTLIWFKGKHLIFSGNFTFDQKENISTNKYYYQYSYSGGIKWKL